MIKTDYGEFSDLFSILSPSYNNAQYLNDWCDSIIAQIYRPLEVVFVNDCSTDKTLEVVDKLFRKLKENNVSVNYSENHIRKYCGSTCKTAYESAKGDFYGVLDTDDMLLPEAISHVMELYKNNPDIGYIYTQFNFCDMNMNVRSKGWSQAPMDGYSLLDMGKGRAVKGKRKHAYSHFRTFSKRVPNLHKIFKDGLKCSVDKYMGYRLEELAPGLFTNKVCYNYRWGSTNTISKVEPAIDQWLKVMAEASRRRSKYNIKPFAIKTI